MSKPTEIISGRRDFDIVTFEDYQKDTDELAERASAVSRQLRKERDAFRALLWSAVATAGGKLRVNRPCTQGLPPDYILIPPDQQRKYEVAFYQDTNQLEFRIVP